MVSVIRTPASVGLMIQYVTWNPVAANRSLHHVCWTVMSDRVSRVYGWGVLRMSVAQV